MDIKKLVKLKKGEVNNKANFVKTAEESFISYYKSLVPWVNRLRREVFPDGRRGQKEDKGLYSNMTSILRKAQKALKALAA